MIELVADDVAPDGVPVCEWVLCRREAELEVVVDANVSPDSVLLCGLHVTPVLKWGRADIPSDPIIRQLPNRPESVA